MNRIVIMAALIISGATSYGIPLQYQIGGGSSVTANNADPGLVIGTELSSDLSGTSFNLNDGQSAQFNFFKIWSVESAVNPVDDYAPKPITATLDFTTPSIDAVIHGVTFGATINWFYDKGVLTWDAPELITVADRTFSVSLSNVEFSKGGGFDFDLGSSKQWVTATVKQVSSGTVLASVPDGGSTVILLGSAVAALGMFRMRSRE